MQEGSWSVIPDQMIKDVDLRDCSDFDLILRELFEVI